MSTVTIEEVPDEETKTTTTESTPSTTTPEPATSTAEATPTAAATQNTSGATIETIEDEIPPLDEVEEVPALESVTGGAGAVEEEKKGKQSRSEKKSRKAMQKLGMKAVPGIERVTVKKSKNILFVISKPDVFKSPGSDTYIIFGEAKIEDISTSALSKKAAQVLGNEGAPSSAQIPSSISSSSTAATALPSESSSSSSTSTEGAAAAVAAVAEKKPEGAAPSAEKEEEKDDEVVDETGLEAKDIDLVLSQTNQSRAKVVKAIRKHQGDIVNAIMELTM